jgi:hypothetical protein
MGNYRGLPGVLSSFSGLPSSHLFGLHPISKLLGSLSRHTTLLLLLLHEELSSSLKLLSI